MSGSALFVGAHADDIEIGCGGTVAKMRESGWNVSFLVMSAEASPSEWEERRREAIAASETLGVPASRVFFAGFPDGSIIENSLNIQKVRDLVDREIGSADVVFVHCPSDQHQDHRASSGIIRAAFRNTPILGYFVPNSMNEESFLPTIYVDTSRHHQTKLAALAKFQSQITLGRILWSRVSSTAALFGDRMGSAAAEAMEIVDLPEALERKSILDTINDAPFSRFWSRLTQTRTIRLIESLPRESSAGAIRVKEFKEREGVELLRHAFSQQWYRSHTLHSITSASERAEDYLNEQCIIIGGGPVSNRIAREYFNHFANVRYVIDYTMPGFRDIRILDRARSATITPVYDRSAEGLLYLRKDFGILTIMPSPMAARGIVVACMGIHSLGTKACFLALSQADLLLQLYSLFGDDGSGRFRYGQVLVQIDERTEHVGIDADSFHPIAEEGTPPPKGG